MKQDFLEEFTQFVKENPELRFWQALLAFINIKGIKADKILIEKDGKTTDTFYI